MNLSLYFYVWLCRRDSGRTFRQSFATWKRFHMYRTPSWVRNGFTHPDLYKR